MNTTPIDQNLKGRILVVDDEPMNRELLHDLLEVNGYAVIEAEDGNDALTKVISQSCDVVLLDVKMPRMDGLEACRRLKSDLSTAHIPVLMVTALTDRDQRDVGIEAGANDYLTKPIDRKDVLLRVRNAVYAKRLHDKVQQDLTKLRELEIMQDNLTHMIVHDMRAPLMAVSWSYELILKEKNLRSPKQREFISMGQNCCSELLEMVSSLLDISRMESGEMPLKQTISDLHDIAQKAAASLTSLAKKKKLTIQVSANTAGVNVDRDIMHRVFVNLLGNAIMFSPANSTIQVDIARSGETARATVTDKGCGIPPEYHVKIFKKFGQVDSRKNEQIHSSGLGLAFCKLAVEAHGGNIGIESPSPLIPSLSAASEAASSEGEAGKGSTFWFTIPNADFKRDYGKEHITGTP